MSQIRQRAIDWTFIKEIIKTKVFSYAKLKTNI